MKSATCLREVSVWATVWLAAISLIISTAPLRRGLVHGHKNVIKAALPGVRVQDVFRPAEGGLVIPVHPGLGLLLAQAQLPGGPATR